MSKPASSGIQTSLNGQAFIPSSRRADGTTRKEIKVRPGYKPPEDVATYKSRTAEGWRTRGGGIPGAENITHDEEGDAKSKNAKRREAARKKKEQETEDTADDVNEALAKMTVQDVQATEQIGKESDAEAERQKKIRNHLKKLKAVRELKDKKAKGEKLPAEQLIKISKEHEIVRDLVKLEYDGPELKADSESARPD